MQSIALLILLVAAVTNARTVLWTAAGGNPLWNNAGNWDCGCLPTANDDVVIDIAAIPGRVQIGGIIAAALCKSLTIGGTSQFSQTLTVTGALNIGGGGGALNSNGALIIETSPNAPLITSGTFTSRGGAFAFSTGVLGGSGSFIFPTGTLLNFTGPASKAISAVVSVAGSAVVSGNKGTSLQLTNGGNLIIDGTFKSAADLTITADNSSSFIVNKGLFSFSGRTLSIEGSANLNSWVLGSSSSATVINSITSGTLSMSSGSVLTLIGSPTDKRTFTSVIGSGTILNEGGSNTFGRLQGSLVASGGSIKVITGSLSSFQLGGSAVSGGYVTAGTAVLSTGTLSGGISLTVDQLTVSGVININDDNTAITVSKTGTIASSGQLTLTGGSSFNVGSGASVEQSGDFKFVQGPPSSKSPTISVYGSWSSSSSLAIFSIPIIGTGTFSISESGSWSFTNVNFAANSLYSKGSIQLSQGIFNVTQIKGTGSISGSPYPLTSSSLEAGQLTLSSSGSATVTYGSIINLSVQGGNLMVQKALQVGVFSFVAGIVSGPAGTQSQITAQSTVLNGGTTTLSNVKLTSSTISLNCVYACQFFTNNAVFRTSSQ